MIDLAELEKAARAATQTGWTGHRMVHAKTGEKLTLKDLDEYMAKSVRVSLSETGSLDFFFVRTEKDDGGADVCWTGNGPTSQANAAYIALCSPANILDLIEMLNDAYAVINDAVGDLHIRAQTEDDGTRSEEARELYARVLKDKPND